LRDESQQRQDERKRRRADDHNNFRKLFYEKMSFVFRCHGWYYHTVRTHRDAEVRRLRFITIIGTLFVPAGTAKRAVVWVGTVRVSNKLSFALFTFIIHLAVAFPSPKYFVWENVWPRDVCILAGQCSY